jgi:predicted ATP-grasp superfamily ATP-dependent carboligase
VFPERPDQLLERDPAPAAAVVARGERRPRWSDAGPDGRVLVTDGHTKQALACVRSLGRAGYDVYVASHYRWPLSAWSRHCRGWFRLTDQTTAQYAALRDWAARRQIGVLLPITEAACLLCNTEREAWEAAGLTVGCGPDLMLLQAFDKARTLEHAARCGIAVPDTWAPESLEAFHAAARELGYPCIVKPRFSNPRFGDTVLPDLGVAYVDGPEALEAAVLERRQLDCWPLLQRCVPGTGKGIFAVCDHGRPIAWFAHQRIRDVRPTGSGSSLRRSTPLDPRLKAASERLLRAMAWHGPVMVEFRDDGEHPPWLMEVNGRFWGSLQLAISSGVDFPLLWLRVLHGETVQARDDYACGITLRWLWGDVKRFFHILRGRPRGYTGDYPTVWQGLRELLGAQPPGTRMETWDRSDPWPALGQLMQGLSELTEWRDNNHRAARGHPLMPPPEAR